MAYTPVGPFANGSATPPINAAFLNGLEAFLATIGAVSNTVNPITGWYHVDNYGAVGDGTTDDRAAIQAAIQAANAAYVSTGARQRVFFSPKTYAVAVTAYLTDAGPPDSTIMCLMLRDGVDLFGAGTVKLKNSQYGNGAYLGIFRTKQAGLSYASIDGITIDGNRANQVTYTGVPQAFNLSIVAVTEVTITNCRIVNANGTALVMTGTTSTPATHLKVRGNRVDNSVYIGIQVSQFDGLDITGNDVSYCTDNAIDIYGENGTTSSNAVNWVISNNRIRNCANGIFPETSASGLVSGNRIYSCAGAGVHVNRINGQPNDILIIGNSISYTPYGAIFTGDMGGVTFRSNTVYAANTAGVQLGDGGSGNASYVNIIDNSIDTVTLNATPLVSAYGGTVSQVRVRGTITKNTSRTYDWVVQSGTTSTGNSISAANAA